MSAYREEEDLEISRAYLRQWNKAEALEAVEGLKELILHPTTDDPRNVRREAREQFGEIMLHLGVKRSKRTKGTRSR